MPHPNAPLPTQSPSAPLAPEDTWTVLVHEGTIQQVFNPDHLREAYRALAESPVPVQAYRLSSDQALEQVPGSQVDPLAWGWEPLDVVIDAHLE